MHKVLIITYYWPPAGGSGVQRWLKFVKYLRRFGWEPVVYTPLNPELMARDDSLEADVPEGITVLKLPIREPYNLYKTLTGKKGKTLKQGFISEGYRKSFLERTAITVKSAFFIPDPKAYWVQPSVKYLTRYLAENPVDALVSTGPPHSMHLIAEKVAKTTGIPWLADFRDPWTRIYNFHDLVNLKYVKRIHKRLEVGVIRNASKVVVVSSDMKEYFEGIRQREVHVITNGFDTDDFKRPVKPDHKKFTITYTGLFHRMENPSVLWKVLARKIASDPVFSRDLQLILAGTVDQPVWDEIASYGLKDHVIHPGYLPHQEVIDLQLSSSVLLLSIGELPQSKAILTGKFFEYLATGRPILAFGRKDAELRNVIGETGSGEYFTYTDEAGVHDFISRKYAEHQAGGVKKVMSSKEKYSREVLTGQLAELLTAMTAEHNAER